MRKNKKKKLIDELKQHSRSEILEQAIIKLVEEGMTSDLVGQGIAEIWLALPEEIK